MTIPFIGIPVLNRGDLLTRCVESIDYSVDRIVIVNNGNDESVNAAIASLESRHSNIESIRPADNLGVAGSWNFFLRNYAAPYYLICGSDIQFTPGDLARIAGFVDDHRDYAVMFGNHGYSTFALTRLGLDLVGYFDENFYPAYLEDCDHFYRTKLLNGKWADVPEVRAIHGEAPHWGSSTIFSNPVFRQRNGITHENNFRYYRAKWGGNNGEEIYLYPFNDARMSPRDWTLDHDLRQANNIWGR